MKPTIVTKENIDIVLLKTFSLVRNTSFISY